MYLCTCSYQLPFELGTYTTYSYRVHANFYYSDDRYRYFFPTSLEASKTKAQNRLWEIFHNSKSLIKSTAQFRTPPL